MNHNYVLENNKYNTLKVIILAVCFLFSMVNLVYAIGIICIGNYLMLWTVFVIWLFLLLVRIPTSFLTNKIYYDFDDECVKITKKYPLVELKPIKLMYDLIQDIHIYNKESSQHKARTLCPKTCALKKYVIKYQNSTYIIALDEYAFCMINRRNNDIFR